MLGVSSDSVPGPIRPSLSPLTTSSLPRASVTIYAPILQDNAPSYTSFLSLGHVYATAYSAAPQMNFPQTEPIILLSQLSPLFMFPISVNDAMYRQTQAKNLEITLDSLLFQVPHTMLPNLKSSFPKLLLNLHTSFHLHPHHPSLSENPSSTGS